MTIEISCKRVANLLKALINQQCEKGFKWYEDVGEMPNMFDMHHAIKMLEKMDSDTIEIIEE